MVSMMFVVISWCWENWVDLVFLGMVVVFMIGMMYRCVREWIGMW